MAKGKRRIRGWHFFVGLIFLCGLSGGIYEWAAARSATRAIKDEVAKLQALGIPTSPEEMPKPGPDDQNAALIYNKAIKLKHALAAKRPYPSFASGPDPEYPANLTAYLKATKPFMELVRRASALPDCNFKHDWAEGPRLELPEYAQFREFTKIAMEIAAIEAERGRFAESFSWLHVGQAISVHARESIVIGYAVSVNSEQLTLRELQKEVSTYYANSEFVRLAREFCDGFGPLPSLREAMGGEILFARLTLADIAEGKMDVINLTRISHGRPDWQSAEFWQLSALRMPSVRLQVEHAHLSRYRQFIENLPRDPSELHATLKAAKDLDALLLADTGIRGDLDSWLMSSLSHLAERAASLEASRRLTRQALEIYAQKSTTGSFPKALDPTKPWAIDPFNQKPFVYKIMSDGFGLYSVGPNLKDDQGSPFYSSTTRGTTGDDIAFFQPPTPPKARAKMKVSP